MKHPIVSKLAARGRRGYLGFSLNGNWLEILFLNGLGRIVAKSTTTRSASGLHGKNALNIHELFHNPAFTTSGIMFSAVHIFFTLADVSLSFRDPEFTVEELFGTGSSPTGRG